LYYHFTHLSQFLELSQSGAYVETSLTVNCFQYQHQSSVLSQAVTLAFCVGWCDPTYLLINNRGDEVLQLAWPKSLLVLLKESSDAVLLVPHWRD